MAFFELDDVFTYQDANDIKKLWASDTAPTGPGTGEVWLDTSTAPNQLKRYNGSSWDIIGDIISPLIIKATGTNSEIQCEREGDAKISMGAAQTLTWIGSDTLHELRFQVNRNWIIKLNNDGSIEVNGSRFFISSTGNVGIGTTTPAAKLDVEGEVKISGNTVWHAGNDGSGSGLDADLLDGIESSSFLRSDADDSFSGTLTSSKTNGAVIKFDNGDSCITVHDGYGNFNIKAGVDENHEIIVSDGGSHIELSESGTITIAVSGSTVGSTFTDDVYIKVSQTGVTINGQTVWHAGNDGSGSGLDADKLDGQEGSFYQDAGNLTTGSIARARLSELGNVNNPYICAGKTNVTTQWQFVNFGTAYTNAPKVVTSVDEAGRIARVISVSTTSFQVQREKTDYPDFTYDSGYIYWIAFGNKA